MGTDEHPTPQINCNTILLTQQLSETTLPAGTQGRLKVSGSELYMDTGSAWLIINN